MGTIGSQFLAQGFEECVASVQKAEEAGYSHAWFVDSQLLWQDCFVYMTTRSQRPGQHRRRHRGHEPLHATRHRHRERVHDAGRAPSRAPRARHRARRQRGADDGPESCQDVRAGRVGPGATRADGGAARDDQRRRRAPPLARPRRGDADHDARDRAEEPAAGRCPRRPRHALRRRQRDVRTLGDRPRSGGRRGGRA